MNTRILCSFLATLAFAGAFVFATTAAEPAPNTLTPAEKAAGWRLLFDGKTTTGWRNFGKQTFPTKGWVIEDGWLKKVAGVRGGDIITKDEFTNFELTWDWRIAKGGNNGVKYFIVENRGAVGHEYQMLGDAGQKPNKGSTASFYVVLPPKDHAPVKLSPDVNHSSIVVQGNHVEHWLNGEKVLEYECGSDEVMAGVKTSKFKNVKNFGQKLTAHIMLTDHSSECFFRNLKIRELPSN